MKQGIWIARDLNGCLYAYRVKPERDDEEWYLPSVSEDYDKEEYSPAWKLPEELIPSLTWDDDPIFIDCTKSDPKAFTIF